MIITRVFSGSSRLPTYCLADARYVCLSDLDILMEHCFQILEKSSNVEGLTQIVNSFYYQVYHVIHDDILLEYSARVRDAALFNREFESPTKYHSLKNEFFKTLYEFEWFLIMCLEEHCSRPYKFWDEKSPLFSKVFCIFFETKADVIEFYNRLPLITRVALERDDEHRSDTLALEICEQTHISSLEASLIWPNFFEDSEDFKKYSSKNLNDAIVKEDYHRFFGAIFRTSFFI